MNMNLEAFASRAGSIPGTGRIAAPLSRAVRRTLGRGPAKDLLGGSWLGHPLHPLLTDIPIGSFTSASLLDLVGERARGRGPEVLIAVGLASAAPTVAAGLVDWADTSGREQRVGVVHAAANAVGLGLYGASLAARLGGRQRQGQVLALAGMGVMSVGGYLGGHLVFADRVGVRDRRAEPDREAAPAA
ncbi:MAG: iron-sulfur protein [Acidimicrobiales bacterium]|nr:iron-sulfur protein [Acidimicrobiales bacterium]